MVKESQRLINERNGSVARLSDLIEEFIKEMFIDKDEYELEIKRNELANYFRCAPSQINYVLTTRFTTDKGYIIESRRGGGGCIKIKKIEYKEYNSLADVISEKIGNSITYSIALGIVNNLLESDIITEREAKIIKIAINDRTLVVSTDRRNNIRADILKSIIMSILS